jgi:hypothetical protein
MNRFAALSLSLIAAGYVAAAEERAGSASVLIATEKSEFKQAVVLDVTNRLASGSVSCRVVGLKELAGVSAADYKAVVILNEVWAWRLRGEVRAFMKKLSPEQRNKIILVSTAGDAKWKTKEEGIHAMTSASTVPSQKKVADFIMAETANLLKAK